VGLDPDEPETPDETVIDGLKQFLDELEAEDRNRLLQKTIPSMAKRAIQLKQLKPAAGFHFCLQQQGTVVYCKFDSSKLS